MASLGAQSSMTTPGIPGVVAAGTTVRELARWDPKWGGEGALGAPDGTVLFAQQDLNKIIRIDKDGKLSTYLEGTNRTIGLAIDAKGRLIGTGGAKPQVVVLAPTRSVLADTYNGYPLTRPNDLVIDKTGGIWFTDTLIEDPPPKDGPPIPPGRKACVFYLTPDGRVSMVTDDVVRRPNGLTLSPDEKVLYVGDPPGEFVYAFDVVGPGRVRNPRKFARITPDGVGGHVDGMTIDAAGRLYTTALDGIQVFAADGQRLGTIPLPAKAATVAFGGPAKKTLYAVGRGGAFAINMLANGAARTSK